MCIRDRVYGLVPVFLGIAVALGYDIVVGGAIVYVGVATGFAAATTNPFSVGIAQSIAEVPMFSGLFYRVVIFLVFQTTAILYVMWYAARVKAHPERSVVYGETLDFELKTEIRDERMTVRQGICLGLFVLTLGFLLYGTMQLGWYIDEIAAMFLMMMIVTGLVGGYSAKMCIRDRVRCVWQIAMPSTRAWQICPPWRRRLFRLFTQTSRPPERERRRACLLYTSRCV